MAGHQIAEIQLLRGLAMILVVVAHTTLAVQPTAGWQRLILDFFNQGARFAVPAFLFISGLVLSYRYQGKALDLPSFYARRLQRVALPYFVWSTLYTVYAGLITGRWPQLPGYLHDLAFGRTWYHLYYLPVILQLYLLTPLLLYLLSPRHPRWWREALLAVAVAGEAFYLADFYYFRQAPYEELWRIQALAGPWLAYFLLGIAAAPLTEPLLQWSYRHRWHLVGAGLPLAALLQLEATAGGVGGAAGTSVRPLVLVYSFVVIPALLGLCRAILRNHEARSGCAPGGQAPAPPLPAAGTGRGACRSVRGEPAAWAPAAAGVSGHVICGLSAVGDHSFGVYLAHPLFLNLLQRFVFRDWDFWTAWLCLPLILGVSYGVARMLRSGIAGALLFGAAPRRRGAPRTGHVPNRGLRQVASAASAGRPVVHPRSQAPPAG